MSHPKWHPERDGLRYVIQQRVFSNFAGSGYVFYRENDKVRRFWLRQNAERLAAALNEMQAAPEESHVL